MEEQVIIVNEANEQTGILPRSVMRRDCLLHRASFVIVTNSKGEILIQKRSPHKDIYPSYYDPTSGGVVKEGESYELNASRELYEELGIQQADLKELFDFYFENQHFKVWGRAYVTLYDGPINPVDGEVESFFFLPESELPAFLNQENIMPDGKMVIQKYLSKNY